MILGYTFSQLVWYFLIYSFIGWCVEVVFCAVTLGKAVNRGFLNGPVCPIYGFGMLAVLLLLRLAGFAQPQDAGAWLLFFGGMVLASAVELFAGWLMLRLFHARWWDYSNEPFNLGGFICLKFSLMWGAGAILVLRVVHPAIAALVEQGFLGRYGWLIQLLLCLLYAADLVVTLVTVAGLNRDLEELDRVSASLHLVSDALSDTLGNTALETDRRLDEGRLQMLLARAEARDAVNEAVESAEEAAAAARKNAAEARALARAQAQEAAAWMEQSLGDALETMRDNAMSAADAARLRAAQSQENLLEKRVVLEKRAELLRADVLNKRVFGGRRLLNAFPHMAHQRHESVLQELRERMVHKD